MAAVLAGVLCLLCVVALCHVPMMDEMEFFDQKDRARLDVRLSVLFLSHLHCV